MGRRPANAGRSGLGFTLVETVVAVAISALILASVAAVASSARRAAAAAEEQALRAQLRSASHAILVSELGRAGAAPIWLTGAPSVPPPYLTITLGQGRSDTVGVRYLDTAMRSDPAERQIAFSASRDRTGSPNLYLRVGSGSRQPALQGIESIEVVALVRGGQLLPPALGDPTGVDGIVLRVRFGWGEVQQLTIPFAAPLVAEIR
jgi:type II secretory pathway pseudopilin PulG